MGRVNDIDLSQLYDDSKSLSEGALTIPGYTTDGWYVRGFIGAGFLDPDKPIRAYSEQERHDLLHKEPTKIRVDGINLTYEGLIPKLQKSMLSKDVDACSRTSAPSWSAPSPSPPARSATAPAQRGGPVVEDRGVSIATPARCRSATWPPGCAARRAVRRPLLGALRDRSTRSRDRLGYLSLDRPSARCPAARRSAPR
jgi:hypothetical protein